ncbi:MAG: C39 family peptidase [Planctomycetota bacterium]
MKIVHTLLALSLLLSCVPVRAEELPSIDDLTAKATKGDVSSQRMLAMRYRDGKGVEKDNVQALRWAHLAADAGDGDAMDMIGHMYLRGQGVTRSPAIAFGYFFSAAPHSSQAAFNLGQCYFGAQGTDLNIPKAIEVWKKASDKGSARAASKLAMIYLAGEGTIAADPQLARKYATRSADLNDVSGLVVLGEMQFHAGELEQAKATWTKASKMKPVKATGQPTQPSDHMSAQEAADLLKLIDYRKRKSEPGVFAYVDAQHVHQGFNNCGATSVTMLARFQGKTLGAWDYKLLCPSQPGTGTDWGDLLKASEKIGLIWKLVTFTPDDDGFKKGTDFLKSETDAGRPVVIDFKFIGPEYPNGEAGHTLTVAGYIAAENIYILRNPAIASPGLELIAAADLDRYWRSNHYGALAKNILSRPAIVIDKQ